MFCFSPAKREPAAKKTKVTEDTIDMANYVKDKTVEKLTVAVLKDYLGSIGVNIGKMKKAELVEEVYNYYKGK